MTRRANDRPPGLCDSCRYGELVRSLRSEFLRCGRSDEEPRFPRYPPLPVIECDGYERRPPG